LYVAPFETAALSKLKRKKALQQQQPCEHVSCPTTAHPGVEPSYCCTPLESCYRAKENEKKQSYDERIGEVEG
jgi:hypothetical protein